MNQEELRKTFEVWASGSGECPGAIERFTTGPYKNLSVEIGWSIWQACAEALTKAVAQAKQEPALVVEREPDYWSRGHFYQGTKPWIDPTKILSLQIGDKLYFNPHPAAPAVPAGWQPIETAPRDGTLFLGWVGAERWRIPDGQCSSPAHDVSQVDFCWWREGGYFDNASGQIGDSQDVTHWMPLPAAPEVKP